MRRIPRDLIRQRLCRPRPFLPHRGVGMPGNLGAPERLTIPARAKSTMTNMISSTRALVEELTKASVYRISGNLQLFGSSAGGGCVAGLLNEIALVLV